MVRHAGQNAYAKCFLDLCGAHPFAFNSKAQLAQFVYLRDHMPKSSIPLVDDGDFDVPVGAGLNPVAYSKKVCRAGEQIHKFDFDSLYPSVMVSRPYPTGLPKPLKITSNLVSKITGACLKARPFEDRVQELTFPLIDARNRGEDTASLEHHLDALRGTINTLYQPLPFGVIKVEIDAPPKRSLRHALLKIAGKHQFTRGVITVCSPELYRAIGLGYKLLKVLRGRVFKQTTTNLFKSYVKTFWKMKIEAGGFPRGATNVEKEKFIEDCLKTTGIQLDQENVKINPGLRKVAKMMLITLWGKFVEKPHDTELKTVQSGAALKKLHEDKRYESIDWTYLPEIDEFQVICRKKQVAHQQKRNSYIAAFTTSYGRLALYNAMHWLGDDQFVYGNTDSIFYIVREGGKVIPAGQFIGELKDELKANEFITKIMCSVNSYVATLNTGEIISSIGGISKEAVSRSILGEDVNETVTHCTKQGDVRRVTKKRRLELPEPRGVVTENGVVYPDGYF